MSEKRIIEPMSRKDFKKYMEDIESSLKFNEELNYLMSKHAECYDVIIVPSCIDDVVDLLAKIFEDTDSIEKDYGLIDYFVWELEFGLFASEEDDIKTVDDLYDELIKNYNS